MIGFTSVGEPISWHVSVRPAVALKSGEATAVRVTVVGVAVRVGLGAVAASVSTVRQAGK